MGEKSCVVCEVRVVLPDWVMRELAADCVGRDGWLGLPLGKILSGLVGEILSNSTMTTETVSKWALLARQGREAIGG